MKIIGDDRCRISWYTYLSLLLIRVAVCPFLTGYVHPDEFYQGGQELFFGCPPTIPWEFKPTNALRSIIPPTVMTLGPIKTYLMLVRIIGRIAGHISWDSFSFFSGNHVLSGSEVLIVPRIFCSLLSIVAVDLSVWSICNIQNNKKIAEGGESQRQTSYSKSGGVPTAVLLLASCWPTMVMLTRPFSNSMECFVLSALMVITLSYGNDAGRKGTHTKNDNFTKSDTFIDDITFGCKVGAIFALGLFTRFTFVFFSFPVVLYMLWCMIFQQLNGNFYYNNGNRIRMFSIMTVVWKRLFWVVSSFIVTACAIMLMDTNFYLSRNKNNSEDQNKTNIHQDENFSILLSFVVTPWNAFLYNSKVSNLADHGIHPRYTHATINMLIMFGPLTIIAYYEITNVISMYIRGYNSGNNSTNNVDSLKRGMIIGRSILPHAVIIFGLGFLSIAPHQEPRFLLPLVAPIVLIGEVYAKKSPKVFTLLWIIFNTSLFTLFGILHQGGVVQSLLKAGLATTSTTSTIGSRPVTDHYFRPNEVSWIYWRTYMPPSFLTRSFSPENIKNVDKLNFSCSSMQSQHSDTYYDTCCNHIIDDKETIRKLETTDCDQNNLVAWCGYVEHRIIDLSGSGIQKLWETIQLQLKCSKKDLHNEDEHTNGSKQNVKQSIFLVAPYLEDTSYDSGVDSRNITGDRFDLSVTGGVGKSCRLPDASYDCTVVRSYSPHLTTEDFPSFKSGSTQVNFLEKLVLNVYNISCRT